MTEAELLKDLREHAFGRARTSPSRLVGAEIEVIPADITTGLMVPIQSERGPSTLPILRLVATAQGWAENQDSDAPKFRTTNGCLVSYEPGGQVEVSSPPVSSVGRVIDLLASVVEPMRDACEGAGIVLREVGVDPVSPPECVPLQLSSERYRRMDRYLAAIGPAGPRMMRQTASLQVNIDWGDDVDLHWLTLNRIAPHLTAIFANSPDYAGADTGTKSFRARTWLDLDPRRTGRLGADPDPATAYLGFALAAPAILAQSEDVAPLPFAELVGPGELGRESWEAHLTTLFPDIRPKGFAEVRCIDAIPARWLAAPLVLLAGLTENGALHRASTLAGTAGAITMERAARAGLADPEIAEQAVALFRIALEGAEALGEKRVEGRALEVGWEYFERFTVGGLSPGDEARHATPNDAVATARAR